MDEYPAIAFWQNLDYHDQRVRLLPGSENGAAGRNLFGLGFCRYDGQGNPPASTRNARFDRIVHGPDRDTSVFIADVTTTLSTVSISFINFPNDPDWGLTANPCWPSTLVDDPGFALLTGDPWYFDYPQRDATKKAYAIPPPLALTQNNPPRPGYQKRFISSGEAVIALATNNVTQGGLEGLERLADQDIQLCVKDDSAGELRAFGKSLSIPKPHEAGPTTEVSHSPPATTMIAPEAGSGVHVAPEATAMPTGGSE